MTQEAFWNCLRAGGTAGGVKYRVLLEITPPTKGRYRITVGTVSNYFNMLQSGMDPTEFAGVTRWFRRVYEHIVK